MDGEGEDEPGERKGERERGKDGRRERQIELLVSLENLFFPPTMCEESWCPAPHPASLHFHAPAPLRCIHGK